MIVSMPIWDNRPRITRHAPRSYVDQAEIVMIASIIESSADAAEAAQRITAILNRDDQNGSALTILTKSSLQASVSWTFDNPALELQLRGRGLECVVDIDLGYDTGDQLVGFLSDAIPRHFSEPTSCLDVEITMISNGAERHS